MEIADKHAEGRVVSVLEGGYDLRALAASVAVHVQALIRGTGDLRRECRMTRTMTMAMRAPRSSQMNFETALAELEDIVEKLESGKVDLEASIAIYERGEALKKHCEKLLKDAEARIEKITLKADGTPSGTEPLDVE